MAMGMGKAKSGLECTKVCTVLAKNFEISIHLGRRMLEGYIGLLWRRRGYFNMVACRLSMLEPRQRLQRGRRGTTDGRDNVIDQIRCKKGIVGPNRAKMYNIGSHVWRQFAAIPEGTTSQGAPMVIIA
jgi:hypothetical protein